jgi:hypothetical protein
MEIALIQFFIRHLNDCQMGKSGGLPGALVKCHASRDWGITKIKSFSIRKPK